MLLAILMFATGEWVAGVVVAVLTALVGGTTGEKRDEAPVTPPRPGLSHAVPSPLATGVLTPPTTPPPMTVVGGDSFRQPPRTVNSRDQCGRHPLYRFGQDLW